MTITMEQTQNFAVHLRARERGAGTIEKYLRDVRIVAVWLGDRALTGEEHARQLEKLGLATWFRHIDKIHISPN